MTSSTKGEQVRLLTHIVHIRVTYVIVERLAAAQCRQELDKYQKTLQGRRLDFREAVLVQVLVNSGALSTSQAVFTLSVADNHMD